MFAELLRGNKASPSLSEFQIGQLETHFSQLLRWNRVINLTSIRDEEEIIVRHYCESLFLADHLPDGHITVADIGSGAGFPGVPLAVARPNSEVTLIESHQRKSVFLKEATRHLSNVRVVSARAESIAGGFDWIVSRGVSSKELSSVSRLGTRAAILGARVEGFDWEAPIRLPWGSERFLNVSRETSG